jgi:uncharacterized membrane protein
MTTITWTNGTTAIFDAASSWAQGVVPIGGDIAVISSSGDPAPSRNAETGIISPATGSSNAYLCGTTLYTVGDKAITQPNGDVYVYFTTPQKSAVPAGETIHPADLDLIGAGSEAALTLQNSTIGVSTVTNVSGDAYIYAAYTNALRGNIRIGLPFSVNGTPVTSTTPDANGYDSALYIAVQPFGSWSFAETSNQYGPSGYVPATTSAGTISVAAHSALWVSVADSPAGPPQTSGKTSVFTPPEVSAFINNGAIKVAAGGEFATTSFGGLGELINNGTITLSGAANETTDAGSQASVLGTGTWTLAGGTQTDAADTRVQFVNNVTDQTIKISDAELWINGGSNLSANNIVVSGGTVDFTGTSGIILIDAAVDVPITTIFNETISGFAKGDQLQLAYGQTPLDGGTWKPELSWNASTNTLDLYNVRSDTGTTLEAAFKLNGTYTAADFSLANVSWNGDLDTPTDVTILTSAAASNFLPSDWSGLEGLSENMPHEAAFGPMASSLFEPALAHFEWLPPSQAHAGA